MTDLETLPVHTLSIPDFALVVLIGISGSGKSSFAARHFLPSEVLSSDAFRAWVSDNENDQAATKDAFEALHYLADIRLRRRKLVVVDATNVQPEARRPLVELAHRHDCLAVALVLDVPERVCHERNRARADRQFGPHVLANQARQFRQSIRNLKREGFRYIHTLDEARVAAVEIERMPLWTDRRAEPGPFDIIGDVHGCGDELIDLLDRMGYVASPEDGVRRHPEGRRAVFLGDLVDRGPKVVETVELVTAMAAAGSAFCVPGNHDNKLMRALKGNPVTASHGLQESLDQIDALSEERCEPFKQRYIAFVDALVSHLWLAEGRLCVAHAGMMESYVGRASNRVRQFALYGDTTGETDEFGLPVRYPWALDYRGATTVVYGHTPVPEAEWLNNTLNIDTGCVFGGKLTALRWPEREIVQVAARRTYAEPVKRPEAKELRPELPSAGTALRAEGASSEPFSGLSPLASGLSLQWQHDELLRAEDVLGKRLVTTSLIQNVMIPAENAAAALEVMSRFAVEPRWLIYLPPTMSPCETAPEGDRLERPEEAFAYYRSQGVEEVVCQKKHMGSRTVLIVCKDRESMRKRFGAETPDGSLGQCVTRTGRHFFEDAEMNRAFLAAAADTLTRAGFWEEFETDWFCLDCELMPWNAKAQGLLREQYAPVGAAARLSLEAAVKEVEQASARGLSLGALKERLAQRQKDVQGYYDVYGEYCWPVGGLEDLKIAPFHLLATEGRTYFDRDHVWHASTLARLSEHSRLFRATEMRLVNTQDAESIQSGSDWWRAMTERREEGMVVKPKQFIVRGPKGLVQPAMKVRGREYLRIIYGPEYTEPENLARLRSRSLNRKRSLALREFALGVESLERFVKKEPLRRVHECVFGVLALESEPVDPRL